MGTFMKQSEKACMAYHKMEKQKMTTYKKTYNCMGITNEDTHQGYGITNGNQSIFHWQLIIFVSNTWESDMRIIS